MNIGYIYIIKNLINNKVYIGQTRVDVKTRWSQHYRRCLTSCNQKIYRAMVKYGRDNFYIETLYSCNIEGLDKLEIKCIKEFDSIRNGYNVSIGGKVYIPIRPDLNEQSLVDEYLNKYTTLEELSSKFGVSRHIVRSILTSNGVKVINRAQPEVYLNIRKEDLVFNLSNGHSIRETSRRLNLPYSTVRKAIIHHNIEYNFSKSARHPKVMN